MVDLGQSLIDKAVALGEVIGLKDAVINRLREENAKLAEEVARLKRICHLTETKEQE